MKTDRELLELAAKAYWGDEIDDVCSVEWSEADQAIEYTHTDNQDHNGCDQTFLWNPLQDDGDALRLAVKRNLWPYASSTNRIGVWSICEDGRMKDRAGVDCWHGDCVRLSGDAFERWEATKEAAVRRAIVVAAAYLEESTP